ncbi:hypothetical protein ACEWY4_014139 [Coilia grayii]|uniref:Selectin P n=1 Tax=Coilia grayii TaxID=363190 RepID=A0ABD1JRG2_9TELE
MLPRVRGYYWIGIRKVEEKWTWVGTRKALTPEAENWAMGAQQPGRRAGLPVACGPLVAPEQGSVSCVHAFGDNRYNSSCRVDCKPGFQLLGAAQTHCQATGHWDQHTPSCKAPHSFTSTCESRCDEGFLLQGDHRIQCGPVDPAPICKAVECPAISDAPSGGQVNCSHPIAPHSFTSTCEFRCDEGFLLQSSQHTV